MTALHFSKIKQTFKFETWQHTGNPAFTFAFSGQLEDAVDHLVGLISFFLLTLRIQLQRLYWVQ